MSDKVFGIGSDAKAFDFIYFIWFTAVLNLHGANPWAPAW